MLGLSLGRENGMKGMKGIKGFSKKLLCLLLVLALALPLFSCARKEDDGKIRILATLFPQYDWLRQVVGDSETVELELLISNGTDPHSYQPTASDIAAISNCDMIVYVGGDSDNWVKKAIERSKNEDIITTVLTEIDGITLCNISSSSHSHEEHSHEGHSHEGHSHAAFDEHLYLSLKNAAVASKAFADELSKLDPKNKELYLKNAEEYAKELLSLDNYLAEGVAATAEEPFMLFADRFPFVYLLSEHHVHYAAAFDGCSADADAGFDTVIRLIKEADAHGVKYVTVTETSDKALANTVISSTKSKNQKILTLNSLQAITKAQIDSGATYISLMRENIDTILFGIGAKN